MHTPNLQLYMEQLSPEKKSKNWQSNPFILSKGEGYHIKASRKGWGTISPQTPPLVQRPIVSRKLKTLSFFLRAKGWYPTTGTPTFKTSTWEKSLKNVWLWRPTGLASQRPMVYGELRTALKGPTYRLTGPKPQGRSSPLKSVQCLHERGSFTNLKALVWGTGACWDALWGRTLVGTIFLISLCQKPEGTIF